MNRIVVIEDDPAILRGLADNLRAESYDVQTASDGEDGYRLIRERHPDLVILDLTLPRLDGYGVCRRMRRNGFATPILMLTAQNQETSRIQGFDAGADDYVTKPFSVRELLGRVRAILRRSEGRPDLASQMELDGARLIQESLLPPAISQISGLDIHGTSRPARIVGGDYFDVLEFHDGSVGVCIADVSGKGLPAALMMAGLQASVKAYASEHIPPRELCAKLNSVLCDSIPSRAFVSFFYAVLTPDRKRLTYCNAGHNAPILRSGGAVRLHQGGGVLGAFREWNYDDQVLHLRSGDRVLMYTDGVTDSRNSDDECFGEERLTAFFDRFKDGDSSTLVQTVIEEVARFSNGNFDDDLTVVAVSIK